MVFSTVCIIKTFSMKKGIIPLYAVLILLVTATGARAQLQRGYILVGADIASLDLGLDEGGNFSFLINPKAAWFIKDNQAIGAYLSVGLSTAKDAGTSVTYGVGALGRYYFNKAEPANMVGRSTFFAEANVGIEGDNPAVGDNTNGLGLGIGPGWTHFVTSNIALEALFKYRGIIGFGSSPTSNNLNLQIGFQIYLPS